MIFYVHILHSDLCQTAKFHSIIPNFDKVMSYYAQSTGIFLHFTGHSPQCTTFCYLAINRVLKHGNYWVITLSETANRIQWKYFLKQLISDFPNVHHQPRRMHSDFCICESAASHPVSAAVHFLAPEWSYSFRLSLWKACSIAQTQHNSQVDWGLDTGEFGSHSHFAMKSVQWAFKWNVKFLYVIVLTIA